MIKDAAECLFFTFLADIYLDFKEYTESKDAWRENGLGYLEGGGKETSGLDFSC